MTGDLVTVANLGKLFGAASGPHVRAVDDVSFGIAPGETLALVGESGCGKSTTGRLILRLLEPTSGRVTYEGRDLLALPGAEMRRMRRHLQMVFQDPYGSLNPRLTVRDILAEPLRAHGMAGTSAELDETVGTLLTQVGLPASAAARHPRAFSGGQRQRIVIARAIAAGPRFVVADEPVSALDVSVQAQIINLLQDLQQQQGLAYLFIAHDLAVVRHIANRVAVMYLGRIVEIGPKRQVFAQPHHPYTQALLSAVLKPDPDALDGRIVLEGDVPSPSAVPPGCSFHTRCPLAAERCRVERPALRDIAPDHSAACHFAAPNPIPQLRG